MSQTSALPEISVIIPAFNAERFLPLQLEALDAQSGAPSYEVVVVDNASTDGTASVVHRLAREVSYPLRLVSAPEHQGPGFARNVGAAHAHADLLMFADADDVVSRWWVRNGARAFESSDLWSGGAPFMTDEQMREGVEGARRAFDDSDEWHAPVPGDLRNAFPVLMGGDFGVTREVFERVGGFDHSLGAVYEDNDFAVRAHLKGIRVDEAAAVRIAYRGKWDMRFRTRLARRSAKAHSLVTTRYELGRQSHFPNPWVEFVRTGASAALMTLGCKTPDWEGVRLRAQTAAGAAAGRVEYRWMRRGPQPQIGLGYRRADSSPFPQADAAGAGENSEEVLAASVVIPARNAEGWIAEQLDSLAAQCDAPLFEVVVADNGSYDRTVQIALSHPAPFQVRVVDASGVPSASHARNVGARLARGHVLLFCDADDFVGDRWVGELYRAVTSGPQLVARGVLEHSRFNDVDVLAAYRIDPAQDLHDTEDSPRIETVSDGFAGYLATVPGNNFAIRRDDYLELGGMDPAYPGGSEETDFVWRAQEAGFAVVQAAGAVVYYRLRTTPVAIFQQQRNKQRGRMYLWTRYRDRGMSGPSVKTSVFAISRHMPMWPFLRRDRGRVLAWAYTVGAHVGALEGMARYRRPALLRSRRPGSGGGTAA